MRSLAGDRTLIVAARADAGGSWFLMGTNTPGLRILRSVPTITLFAQSSYEWGMVNELCEPGTVLKEALAAAQRIADCAPLSLRQAKKSIHFGLQTDLHSGYRIELEAYYRLLDTDDRREGIAAFNEKRKPRFTGS